MNKMKKIYLCLAVPGIVLFFASCGMKQAHTAKYVFVFMGDGMGINQAAATRYWEAQQKGQTGEASIWKEKSFDSFPVTGFMSTHNINMEVTDSAASATSVFSGKKTQNGCINCNSETEETYTPFAKTLTENGYSVGVISTTSLEHASPAAMYAVAKDRYEYADIAHQGITSGWLDFWAAGGFQEEEEALFKEAEAEGFTLVRTKEEMEKLDNSSLPVLAAAGSRFSDPYMEYEIDRAGKDISFADFVNQAILCMEEEEKFFLFAEAGKIDMACSNGDMISAMHEVKALDNAVEKALEFYEKYPKETLIIVIADHETGSMRIRKDMDCSQISGQVVSYKKFEKIMRELYENKAPFSEAMKKAKQYFAIEEEELEQWEMEELESTYREMTEKNGDTDFFTRLLCRLKADRAKIQLVSGSHSGQPVPVYAVGKNAEKFSGVYDNTEIYTKLSTAMGLRKWR